MPGTRLGGLKAAETNKILHGADFYARIGAKGGRNGHTGGFAANPELARIVGAKGGKISKRKGGLVKIKVKRVKDFDYTIPVHKEKEPSQEDIVLALRRLSDEDYETTLKQAKAYRKADRIGA